MLNPVNLAIAGVMVFLLCALSFVVWRAGSCESRQVVAQAKVSKKLGKKYEKVDSISFDNKDDASDWLQQHLRK